MFGYMVMQRVAEMEPKRRMVMVEGAWKLGRKERRLRLKFDVEFRRVEASEAEHAWRLVAARETNAVGLAGAVGKQGFSPKKGAVKHHQLSSESPRPPSGGRRVIACSIRTSPCP